MARMARMARVGALPRAFTLCKILSENRLLECSWCVWNVRWIEGGVAVLMAYLECRVDRGRDGSTDALFGMSG